MSLTLYLSGPMRGLPQHNFPAFRTAAVKLRALGYKVCSPVELDEMDGYDPEVVPSRTQVQAFLRRDIRVLLDVCDAICLLPGHGGSFGACLERDIARSVGLTVYRYCQSTDGKVWLEEWH